MRGPLDVRHARAGEGDHALPGFDVSTPAGMVRGATPAEVEAAEFGREAFCDGYDAFQVREGAKAGRLDPRFAVAGYLAAEFWAEHVEADPFPVEAGCAPIDSPEFARVVAWWDRIASRVYVARDVLRQRMADVLGTDGGIFADAEGEA